MATAMQLTRHLVLCSLLFSHVALADYVVLQSESGTFALGQVIADIEGLQLSEGENLVLLSEQGEVLRLVGDTRTARADTSNEQLMLMLNNLVRSKRDEHISLGGTRGGSGIGIGSKTKGNAPVFSLDPFISGIQCLVGDAEVLLYRGDTRNVLQLKVLKAQSRESGTIKWGNGQHEAEWPINVPIEEGAQYTIRREGYMESSVIQLEWIPAVSMEDRSSAVVWLAAKRCIPQAERLLNLLELDEVETN